MTDRELLEAAARAAGIEVMRSRLDDKLQRNMLVRNSSRNPHHENGPWNPLTDDGDALRLAVARGLTVHHYLETREVGVCLPYCDEDIVTEFYDADPYAATRRAIVRAAASMGEKA